MPRSTIPNAQEVLASAAALAVLAFVALRAFERWWIIDEHLPAILLLALPAAFAARAGRPTDGSAPLRLTLSFVLAGLWLLPEPASALPGVVACLGARGGGIAGPPSAGVTSAAVVLVSVLAAVELQAWAPPLVVAGSPWSFAEIAFLFAVVQGGSLLFSVALGRWPAPQAATDPLRRVLAEGVNVVPAWLLVGMLAREAYLTASALGALLVAAAAVLARQHDDARAYERVRRSLSRGLEQIDTVHAAGRELAVENDPDRLAVVLERECRKALGVRGVDVVVLDETTGDFRRIGSAETAATDACPRELLERVFDEKRPSASGPFRAIPLQVEDRMLGAVAVRFDPDGPAGPDDPKVLATLGQSAAAALDRILRHRGGAADRGAELLPRNTFLRFLELEYHRARRHGGSLAVLAGDVDRLAEINRRHGRSAGTRFLRALASRIRTELRISDSAGWSGDDAFSVALVPGGAPEAVAVARRIRASVAELIVEDGTCVVRATVCIGIACYPDHDTGRVESLLQRADQALYRAKRYGPGRVALFGEPIEDVTEDDAKGG